MLKVSVRKSQRRRRRGGSRPSDTQREGVTQGAPSASDPQPPTMKPTNPHQGRGATPRTPREAGEGNGARGDRVGNRTGATWRESERRCGATRSRLRVSPVKSSTCSPSRASYQLAQLDLSTSRTGPNQGPAQLVPCSSSSAPSSSFFAPTTIPALPPSTKRRSRSIVRGQARHDAATAAAGRQRQELGRDATARARGRVARGTAAARAAMQP